MPNSKTSLIVQKKSVSPLTPDQKTFSRLIAKIKKLQDEQKAATHQLDEALQVYHDKIRPKEDVLRDLYEEGLKICFQFYKNPNDLSKTKQKIFKNWIAQEVTSFCRINDPFNVSEDMRSIFNQLSGISYEDHFLKDLENLKNEMEKKYKAAGMNVDFSSIDMSSSKEDIMHNFFQALGKAVSENKKLKQERSKTKKQQEKELEQRTIQDVEKKSIGGVYKQLAKILHPDLEQDPEQRVLKEECMKQLTNAYRNNDIYTLLMMKMEWVNRAADQLKSQSDDTLKAYNVILQDQAKAMQEALDMLVAHPKYAVISHLYGNPSNVFEMDLNEGLSVASYVSIINMAHKKLEDKIVGYQNFVKSIQSSKADQIFQNIIQQSRSKKNF